LKNRITLKSQIDMQLWKSWMVMYMYRASEIIRGNTKKNSQSQCRPWRGKAT